MAGLCFNFISIVILTFVISISSGKVTLDKTVAKSLTKNFQQLGSDCDPNVEKEFYGKLRVIGNANQLQELLAAFKDKVDNVCDRFQYLTCDSSSKLCVCRKETFSHSEKGPCYLQENIILSCHPTLAPHWINEPVELMELSSEHLKSNTGIQPVAETECDKFSYSYVCKEGENCKQFGDKFKDDYDAIMEVARKDLSKWIEEGEKCDRDVHETYLKDGKYRFTIDFAKLSEALKNGASKTICNILNGFACNVSSLCSCPFEDEAAVETYYRRVSEKNQCKALEGEVCSQYFWHDGGWKEHFLECGPDMECVMAPDGINRICCSPSNTVTGKGRCRCNDQIPFLKVVRKNNTYFQCRGQSVQIMKSTVAFFIGIRIFHMYFISM